MMMGTRSDTVSRTRRQGEVAVRLLVMWPFLKYPFPCHICAVRWLRSSRMSLLSPPSYPCPVPLCILLYPASCKREYLSLVVCQVCGARQKTYLDQEQEVRVLALGSGTLTVLDVLLGDINTLKTIKLLQSWECWANQHDCSFGRNEGWMCKKRATEGAIQRRRCCEIM